MRGILSVNMMGDAPSRAALRSACLGALSCEKDRRTQSSRGVGAGINENIRGEHNIAVSLKHLHAVEQSQQGLL